MKPLSTRIFKLEATYDEILHSMDTHAELKKMKALVMDQKVVFFIYRGCEQNAIVMMCNDGTFHASVQACPKNIELKTDPDLLYALCYGNA